MSLSVDKLKADIAARLSDWEVYGCALTVVLGGEILCADGVGARNADGDAFTPHTLTQIASCSKAFTAALAGVCATRGLLDFDTPVVEYMPEFRLSDEYATDHLTVRDFLSHRSGMPRHEYAWYGTGFTREELMDNLKHLQMTAPIRYRYQYSNLNYLIVGALIERVTGMSFEQAMKTMLLDEIGMNESHVFVDEIESSDDRITGYEHAEQYVMHSGIVEMPYYTLPGGFTENGEKIADPTGPAGCIVSTPSDMAKWLLFNLNRGRIGNRRLVREDLMDVIISPHVDCFDDSHGDERSMSCYGLGWGVNSHRGYKMMEHGGNLPGISSSACFVPALGLGVFVSANLDVTMLADAVVCDVIDRVIGVGDVDWYDRMYTLNDAMFRHVIEYYRDFGGTPAENTAPSHPIADYAGVYEAPGYRRFLVTERDGRLFGDFNTCAFGLRHYHYDSFATDERILELPAGVIVSFETDPRGCVQALSVTLGGEAGLRPIRFVRQ